MKRFCFKKCGLFAAVVCVITLSFSFSSCASASTSFTVSQPSKIPQDFFGISPDRSPLEKEDFELLDDFSAVWIRTTIRWAGVERQEGVWDFDRWDIYVDKAEAAGKKVIIILGFDNPWLYSDNKEKRDLAERELPYYLKYVEQVVTRYKTRVVYEIWNEPNWVFWKGSDKNFFALSAAAAKKIRELEPDALILAGSTSRVDAKFTRGMFKSGAMENTDGFSVHPYGTSPVDTMRQINKLKKILNEFKYDKPIWVTEVGYSTGPVSFCHIRQYPEYIVKTLSSLSTQANGIRNVIWYELMDNYNPGEVVNRLDPENYFGLIHPNKTFKNGAEAFMLTAGYLAGAEYSPNLLKREKVSKNITSYFFVREDGESVLILWNNGMGKKKVRLSVANAQDISNHNIINREITILKGEPLLEIGKEPVFITWKGGENPRLLKK